MMIFGKWEVLFVELLFLTGSEGLELFWVSGGVFLGLEDWEDRERDSELFVFDLGNGLTFLSGGYSNSLRY